MTGEDLPFETNRVELSNSVTDRVGLPVPRIRYQIPEGTTKLVAWHAERAVASMREAGATTISSTPLVPMSAHMLGTARMGNDPRHSVVNRFGMAHDVPNLGIVDGSVFVTSGGVNPTSTICALASRVAATLLEHRSTLPRPELARTIWLGQSRTVGSPIPPEVGEPIVLTSDERARLAALAEILIPGTDDRPSPRTVGVAEGLADAVLEARPDLGAALRRALQVVDTPVLVLAFLDDTDRGARDALELTVAGAYYLSSEVREAVGYPGQLPQPALANRYPEYVEEGLLDHLLERQQKTT
jgi:hypothetical protein